MATSLLILLTLGLAWMHLSATQRGDVIGQVRGNLHTLMALTVLFWLPALLLAPLPEWPPRWLVLAISLCVWGFFLAVYWDTRVIPAANLIPPTAPYRPDFLVPLPAPPTDEGSATDGDIHKAFQWTFAVQDGEPRAMSLELMLSSERYGVARAEPRRPVGKWAHYAEQDMPELHALQAAFSRLHQQRNWSTLSQAGNVLSFIQQCMNYLSDEESTPAPEWPRYPVETLVDEAGDCEDDVILAAAILKRLGFDVALLYYPGHVALGVAGARGLPGDYVAHEDERYFYGETTAEGWLLGETPEQYRGRRPDKVEVVKRELAI